MTSSFSKPNLELKSGRHFCLCCGGRFESRKAISSGKRRDPLASWNLQNVSIKYVCWQWNLLSLFVNFNFNYLTLNITVLINTTKLMGTNYFFFKYIFEIILQILDKEFLWQFCLKAIILLWHFGLDHITFNCNKNSFLSSTNVQITSVKEFDSSSFVCSFSTKAPLINLANKKASTGQRR